MALDALLRHGAREVRARTDASYGANNGRTGKNGVAIGVDNCIVGSGSGSGSGLYTGLVQWYRGRLLAGLGRWHGFFKETLKPCSSKTGLDRSGKYALAQKVVHTIDVEKLVLPQSIQSKASVPDMVV
jgi:hypothetical protein